MHPRVSGTAESCGARICVFRMTMCPPSSGRICVLGLTTCPPSFTWSMCWSYTWFDTDSKVEFGSGPISDALVVYGTLVEDADLVYHTLRGLPNNLKPFIYSIKVQINPILPDELHILLLSKEISLLQRRKQPQTESIYVFHKTSPQGFVVSFSSSDHRGGAFSGHRDGSFRGEHHGRGSDI
ncbi:unnamed protein product [Prunus armeniaca]